MDQVLEAIATLLGVDASALTSGAVFGMFGLLFIAVFVGVMGVSTLFRSGDAVQRRMTLAAGPEGASPARVRGSVERSTRWNDMLKLLEQQVAPMREDQRSALRQKMMQAGYFDPSAPRIYFALRAALAVALPVLYVAALPFLATSLTPERTVLTAVIMGAVGLYGPTFWRNMKTSERQRAVREGFPDALDMLVVCVEAGLGFDAAFNRVGTQIQKPHPVLAQHFAMVSVELRAGKSREDALRNLSQRVGIDDVSSFVTLLIQSDSLGTSIAQTLRVHADEMREKRMSRAEEKAHMLPVLLSIPLVTCILPSMIMVVLLPGIIGIVRQLLPALTGNR
jgi:tight adherence protein C